MYYISCQLPVISPKYYLITKFLNNEKEQIYYATSVCVCVCVCGFSAVLLFQSCSKNNPEPLVVQQNIEPVDMATFLSPDEIKSLSFANDDFYRTEDEVLDDVKAFLSVGSDGGQKSGVIITNIKPISGNSLKSGNNNCDNNLYVVETKSEDGEGFLIASADKRIPTILSHSKNGEVEDTTFNTGLSIFINRAETYIEQEKAKQEQLEDSLCTLAKAKLTEQLPDSIQQALKEQGSKKATGYYWVYNTTYTPWRVVQQKAAMVKTKWGQGSPYNDKCPYANCSYSNGRCPAGCVAIAITQIMGYHKVPSSFNWAGITRLPTATNLDPTEKAHLAEIIYNTGLLSKMSYSCSGSGSTINNAYYTFAAAGYTSDAITAYYWSTVYSSLINNRPVYIRGCKEYGGCHAWLLDGFSFIDRNVSNYATLYYNGIMIKQYVETTYQPIAFVNCNYGWDGLSNGLYVSGVFNTSQAFFKKDIYTITNLREK